MNVTNFITELFCKVDDAIPDAPRHSQAIRSVSEVVTVGILYGVKGVSQRAFYPWLRDNGGHLFPKLPERTRRFHRLHTQRYWTGRLLAAPTLMGVADSYGGVGKTTAERQAPTGYAGIYTDWNSDISGDGTADDSRHFGNAGQCPVLQYGGLAVADQRRRHTSDGYSYAKGLAALQAPGLPPMLATLRDRNGIAIPEAVMANFPDTEYFEATCENDRIALTPIRLPAVDGVRDERAAQGITEADAADAIAWARRCRLP